MDNKEILDNKRTNSTHIHEVKNKTFYLLADPDAYVSEYKNGKWTDNDVNVQQLQFHTVRSLADIERIAELEQLLKHLVEHDCINDSSLEKEAITLLKGGAE